MPVTITKPQATLRELLATLKKRTGLFGEQIIRANTIDEYYGVRGTNRNLVINGDFRISQRGDYTTAANLPSSTFTLDRWISYMSVMTATLQHTTVTLNSEPRRAAKITLTNSAGGEALLEQRIEPVNMIPSKVYTLSAWVRTTNQTIRLRVHDGLNWIHSATNQYASPTGQWQKITFTYLYNGPIAGYHPVQMYCSSGTSGEYYEFTDFQLEEGTVATPFERRLIGQELQLCQRYYCNSFATGAAVTNGGAPGYKGIATAYETSSLWIPEIPYPVRMRTAATITLYLADTGSTNGVWGIYTGGSWVSMSGMTPYDTNSVGFYISATYSGRTIGSTYLTTGNWTASAEL
jgi:hypothetical protein